MVSVTADNNVYISAFNFGGAPEEFLRMARAGDIELYISDDILSEILRVLRDKFRWNDEALALARERIADFAKTTGRPKIQARAIARANPTSQERDMGQPFSWHLVGITSRPRLRSGWRRIAP